MFPEVIIDMKNGNSLIALAYIKETKNPYETFCFYIQYCLAMAPDQSLSNEELLEKIEEQFSFRRVSPLISPCMRILQNEGKVERLRSGMGYRLLATINTDYFDAQRTALKEKEEDLILSLIAFVKLYGQDWSYDEARDYFTCFLVARENAASMFLESSLQQEDQARTLSPPWYIGNFISKILEGDGTSKDYLQEIVNGLMVYLGVYQINEYKQEWNQKFSGTQFYLDTKLLLRVMGFSTPLEVATAKELVRLITEEYNGLIYVFQHTVDEVCYAMANAAEALKRRKNIFDPEMRFFRAAKRSQ